MYPVRMEARLGKPLRQGPGTTTVPVKEHRQFGVDPTAIEPPFAQEVVDLRRGQQLWPLPEPERPMESMSWSPQSRIHRRGHRVGAAVAEVMSESKPELSMAGKMSSLNLPAAGDRWPLVSIQLLIV